MPLRKTLEGLEWKDFKKLGLPDIDSWFDSVAEIVNTVADLGEACDTAQEGIMKCLEATEMIEAGVEDKTVKGVVKYMVKTTKAKGGTITFSGNKLVVTGAEGCGPGWLIFDGVNKLVEALITFIKEIPELYPKIETFVQETAALPDKIQSAAAGLGNPMKIPGIVKNGATNIKILGSVPGVMKSSVESCKSLMETIKDAIEDATD